jgi:pyruvate ferredoxin oxidoreductase gamma subunit
MREIRFHGRGGQGTVVAAVLLAKAFFKAGHFVQTFPLFGVERRGAPVEAYLRTNDQKIRVRSNIYTPDHVMVQDVKILNTVNVTQGLKPGGWILINGPGLPPDAKPFAGFRLASVDATQIALTHGLGTRTHPMINTAMVGAFAKMLEMPPLEAITDAITEEISVKTNLNIDAAQEAYGSICMHGMV